MNEDIKRKQNELLPSKYNGNKATTDSLCELDCLYFQRKEQERQIRERQMYYSNNNDDDDNNSDDGNEEDEEEDEEMVPAAIDHSKSNAGNGRHQTPRVESQEEDVDDDDDLLNSQPLKTKVDISNDTKGISEKKTEQKTKRVESCSAKKKVISARKQIDPNPKKKPKKLGAQTNPIPKPPRHVRRTEEREVIKEIRRYVTYISYEFFLGWSLR